MYSRNNIEKSVVYNITLFSKSFTEVFETIECTYCDLCPRIPLLTQRKDWRNFGIGGEANFTNVDRVLFP